MKKIAVSLASLALMAMVSCDNFNQAKKSATDAVEQVQQEAGDAMNQMKEEAGQAVDNMQEKMKDMISGIEVPKFGNADVQKVANEYATYLKDAAEAVKSGSTDKVQELQAKAAEWQTKMQEVATKLTPEDATKWSEWMQKISEFQSK